ncbi:hypothetical protein [Motilimonas pumila]|uniref:Uncharacterized protein n=1 Tax=Motilimonas pumila TaxID=2303987 RepID=A0A418Y914_9GAMM|nr:hypothetical protein [Motilimonas pumila]RJG35980.1 hypothetical protein D1Z90_20625 [Motilimonas pumila]
MKIKSVLFYVLPILLFVPVCIEIGAELITQYYMYINEYSGIQKHLLADDMGFGFLLMLGLIPEIVCGMLLGAWVGKKLNAKFNKYQEISSVH